jgi:hypothetical protein
MNDRRRKPINKFFDGALLAVFAVSMMFVFVYMVFMELAK